MVCPVRFGEAPHPGRPSSQKPWPPPAPPGVTLFTWRLSKPPPPPPPAALGGTISAYLFASLVFFFLGVIAHSLFKLDKFFFACNSKIPASSLHSLVWSWDMGFFLTGFCDPDLALIGNSRFFVCCNYHRPPNPCPSLFPPHSPVPPDRLF